MHPEYIEIIREALSHIQSFLNSDLLIAGIGAFAGAYGGQYIAEKKRTKDVVLAEIRSVNSAISCTFNILNTYINYKKNHVQKLFENFNGQRDLVIKALNNNLFTKVNVQFDLQTLMPPLLPTDLLLKLVTEKITLDATATNICLTLLQTNRSLNDSLNSRNSAILDFKKANISGQPAANLFFGLPLANGSIDSTFKDCVESIHSLLDDCIFFSDLLIKMLIERGESLKKDYSDSSISIAKIDLTKSREAGLFPDLDHYKDWL